jgi:heme-degrading monooxygenase HmoA
MIVRVWKATASREGAAGYVRHFETVVRPELSGVPGFGGALLMQREQGESVEIVVETRWSSLQAIRAFAGDDVERAVVEEGARAVLSEFGDRAAHYEIMVEVGGGRPREGGVVE